jgi:hypothetical protein
VLTRLENNPLKLIVPLLVAHPACLNDIDPFYSRSPPAPLIYLGILPFQAESANPAIFIPVIFYNRYDINVYLFSCLFLTQLIIFKTRTISFMQRYSIIKVTAFSAGRLLKSFGNDFGLKLTIQDYHRQFKDELAIER